MERSTRRAYLAAVVGAATAGCLGGDQATDTPSRADPTDTDPPGTATPTATESPPRLVVEPIDVAEAAAAGSLTVYPSALKRWLREAATGGTVRAFDDSYDYMPEPVLPKLDAVRLETPEGGVDGTYDLTAEGGTRYELLVGADPADPPADATVTHVEDLPAERREFALAAIDPGERATVYPETDLGEWVREGFFGGYVRHDGETYRGTEVQQTDAEFFSTRAWYVLSLSPAPDADDPVSLRLPEFDPAVSNALGDLLDERTTEEVRTERPVRASREAVATFAERTDYLLTHAEVLTVELEE